MVMFICYVCFRYVVVLVWYSFMTAAVAKMVVRNSRNKVSGAVLIPQGV